MVGWVKYPASQERSDRLRLLRVIRRIVIGSETEGVGSFKDLVLLSHCRDVFAIWTSSAPAVVVALGKGSPDIFFEKVKEALQTDVTVKWTSSQKHESSITIGFNIAKSYATTVELYYVLDLDTRFVDRELKQVLDQQATSNQLLQETHPSLRPVIALVYRHLHAWALQRGLVNNDIGLINDTKLLTILLRTLYTSVDLKTGSVHDESLRTLQDHVQGCRLSKEPHLAILCYAYAMLWKFFVTFGEVPELQREKISSVVFDEMLATSRGLHTSSSYHPHSGSKDLSDSMHFAQRIRAGTLPTHYSFCKDYQVYVKFSVSHWTASKRRRATLEAGITESIASLELPTSVWIWPMPCTTGEEHSIFIAVDSSLAGKSEAEKLCQRLEQAYDSHMRWQDSEDLIPKSEYFVQARVLDSSEMAVAWREACPVIQTNSEVDFNEDLDAAIINAVDVTEEEVQGDDQGKANSAELDPRLDPLRRWFVEDMKAEIADGYQKLFWFAAKEQDTLPVVQKETVDIATLANTRTETEALNRIAWDPHYDEDDYLIGYEDRHEGIKEIPFLAWKRESTELEFIPVHRIRYIKKKSQGAIVWGRNSKWRREAFGSQE